MSKLADLKKAAEDKLASVHADVLSYVNALESKVSANKYTVYAACGLAIILVVVIWHFTHK